MIPLPTTAIRPVPEGDRKFPDLYPEFGPEPISCPADAVAVAAFPDGPSGLGGRMLFCADHLDDGVRREATVTDPDDTYPMPVLARRVLGPPAHAPHDRQRSRPDRPRPCPAG